MTASTPSRINKRKLDAHSDLVTAAVKAATQMASHATTPTPNTGLSTRTMTSKMSSATHMPSTVSTGVFWPNGTEFRNTTLIRSPNLCTIRTCPLTLAPIPYIPSHAGNSLYLTGFLLILLIQIAVGIRHRTWGFLAAFVAGEFLEIMEYAARIHLHFNPFSMESFLINLTCLTIAPCFLLAGIYLCFSRIVIIYGQNFARLKPELYSIIFMSSDAFSLFLQALGGILADISKPESGARQSGINLMIAGLIFQVISLGIFSILGTDFAWRSYRHKEPNLEAFRRFSLLHLGFGSFILAFNIAIVCIFFRTCYRISELLGGFDGPVAALQTIFMAWEGGLILAASFGLTVMHPGLCF